MSTTKVYSLNVLQRFIFGFCICMFMFACSKENAQTKTGLQNGKTYETNQISEVQNNGENYSNRGQSLLEFAEERYNVEVRENQDGSFSVLYNDGKVLKIFQTSENEARISGSKINNEFYNVGVIADENGLVTDVEYEGKVAPCNEHPGGESWEDCFKREVDEFCDGPAGCITLYSPFGIIVAVMIAVHCADC